MDPHVFALDCGAVLYRDALIQTVHVLHLTFWLMLENDLTEPVYNNVHVDFYLVTCTALKEWRKLRQLHGCPRWRLEPRWLIDLKEDPQGIEF